MNKKTSFLDNLNQPLPDVESAWIRRPVTIFLGIIFLFPIYLICGMMEGIKNFWNCWIKECW